MKYVIRIKSKPSKQGGRVVQQIGPFLAAPGSSRARTRLLSEARIFDTREEAEGVACDNEVVLPVDDELPTSKPAPTYSPSSFKKPDLKASGSPVSEKQKRGFAAMDPELRRELGRRGGKAAHGPGALGHEFSDRNLHLNAERLIDPSSFERRIIGALADARGNVMAAADVLDVSRRTLTRYIEDSDAIRDALYQIRTGGLLEIQRRAKGLR